MVDRQQWLAYTDWLKQRGQKWPKLRAPGELEQFQADVIAKATPPTDEMTLAPGTTDKFDSEPIISSAPQVGASLDETNPQEQILSRVALCGDCSLAKCRDLPDATSTPPWGRPNAPIAFLWDGRGQLLKTETAARDLLQKMTKAMGLGDQDYYCVPVLSCPIDVKPDDPAQAIVACRNHWQAYLAYGPKIAVPLGALATQALFGARCHFPSLRGQAWQSNLLPGTKIIPTYHPRDLIRVPSGKRQAWQDLQHVMTILNGEGNKTS